MGTNSIHLFIIALVHSRRPAQCDNCKRLLCLHHLPEILNRAA